MSNSSKRLLLVIKSFSKISPMDYQTFANTTEKHTFSVTYPVFNSNLNPIHTLAISLTLKKSLWNRASVPIKTSGPDKCYTRNISGQTLQG